MGRAKLPASLQKGNTWSKEQLQQLDALEQEMRGKDDVVDEVPEHLDDFAKVYYGYLIDNLNIIKNILLDNNIEVSFKKESNLEESEELSYDEELMEESIIEEN